MQDNIDLIKAFHTACNNLAEAVNMQLFEGSRTFYWVANDIGGICDFEDSDFLSPEDMVRILKVGMTYDKYAEWRDANMISDKYINLSSWLKGLRHNMINTYGKI